MNSNTAVNKTAFMSTFLGSFICWYDFFIFAFATAMIFAPQFFPGMNFLIPLMVFAVGFLARPLGSIVFGHWGDRFGRKRTLLATLMITAASTVLIGMLPSYTEIGILAPILLITLRILQTCAFGAELAVSSTIMYESHADQKKRGFLGSFLSAALPLATVTAGLMFMLAHSFGPDAFKEWAWRIPFLASAVLFAVGFYVRLKLSETDMFLQNQESRKSVRWPVITVFREHWKKILLAVGISHLGAAWNYVLLVFGISYFVTAWNIPRSELSNTVTMLAAIGIPIMVVFGWLGDRLGRLNLYQTSAIGLAALTFPILTWMSAGQYFLPFLLGYLILGKMSFAGAPTMYAELFPTEVRQTGVGIIYNFAALIGGGVAPMLAQALYNSTNDIVTVGWMLIASAAIALVSGQILRRYHSQT